MNLIWKIYTVYNKIAIDLILYKAFTDMYCYIKTRLVPRVYALSIERPRKLMTDSLVSCEVKVQESRVRGRA